MSSKADMDAAHPEDTAPSSTFESSKPDWDLRAHRKGDHGRWLKIGAGWSSERGGINIRLNGHLTLDLREVFGSAWSVYLFPHRPKGRGREFGSWPTGDPRNCQPGESMEQFHARLRAEARRSAGI